MKLHDLSPAPGSRRPRTRVGRGIAAGKGKTAGRGTKGQKSRTGHGSLPAWFEGGQTPIHIRIPKLRGFRNRFRTEYEIVNVGRISALAETGVLDAPETGAKDAEGAEGAKPDRPAKSAPVTITPDILAAAGLVSSLDKPLKILGQGEVTRPLFIVADAFSKSATAKIEKAGGTATVLELPSAGRKTDEAAAPVSSRAAASPKAKAAPKDAEAPKDEAASKAAPAPEAAASPETEPTEEATPETSSASEADSEA